MSQLHGQLKDLASGRSITPSRRATNPVSPRRSALPMDPLPRPKSQSLSPRRESHDLPVEDDTLKRKPRRPAPTKPAPRAPPTRGRIGSQEEPLVISNTGRTERESKSKAKPVVKVVKRNEAANNERAKKKPAQSTAASKPKVTKQEIGHKKKPGEGRRNELPLPREMSEALHEDQAMAEDDFILEPPQKFSQSSLDDLTPPPRPRLQFQDISDDEDKPKGGYRANRKLSSMEQKIKAKKKVLNRQETPAVENNMTLENPAWESDENQSDEFDNQSDEFGNQSDEFDNQSDEFDERGAMEEDELPSVVYDEDIAALIW